MPRRSAQGKVMRRKLLQRFMLSTVVYTLVFLVGAVLVQNLCVDRLAAFIADETSEWTFYTTDEYKGFVTDLEKQGRLDELDHRWQVMSYVVQGDYGSSKTSDNAMKLDKSGTAVDAGALTNETTIDSLEGPERTYAGNPYETFAQAEGLAQGSEVFAVRDLTIYNLFKSLKLPFAALLYLLGLLICVLLTLNKSIRYFDQLAAAVSALLADPRAPVRLPDDLSITRSELIEMRSSQLQAQSRAKEAEERKNELVAYLAHDIRTPLTSVMGYLDILRDNPNLDPQTAARYAGIAYEKAERLESLVEEFFEITRFNLQSIPLERQNMDLRLFLQQLAEELYPNARERNLSLEVDAPADVVVFADPDKLARALTNVLRNAVAYADAGTAILLSARVVADQVVIDVANRGREISQAHLQSIFEKFYREESARSTDKGGAGLGLAIAREIVTAHKGSIDATSENGVTTFTVRLPLHP
ncbi:MAG: sensor histidine kinase [Coriobacteriales bacterium]